MKDKTIKFLATWMLLVCLVQGLTVLYIWDIKKDIRKLQSEVQSLNLENMGQWKRISQLEQMPCNPELIECE